MKIVCYFADKDGSHPNCSTADYNRMWPIMEASVNRCGYDLIHLTSLVDRPRCENTIRYDIDPATVMFSRELAWRRFLESLPERETACLVEPDAYLLRPIPPLAEGADMMLLQRPGKTLPSGFRLARRSALPFYRAVVDLYSTFGHDDKVFHGDCKVHHSLLGIGKCGATSPPTAWLAADGSRVEIEVRNWIDYTSKLWRNAVAWNFKGTSKHIMLAMAEGKMPEMR